MTIYENEALSEIIPQNKEISKRFCPTQTGNCADFSEYFTFIEIVSAWLNRIQ